MSSQTRSCPKCGGTAAADHTERQRMEHRAMHYSAHAARHHPALALFGLACLGLSKILPRTFRCSSCGHSFLR